MLLRYYSFGEHVFRSSLLSESTVYLIVQLSVSSFFIKKLGKEEKKRRKKICQHTYLPPICTLMSATKKPKKSSRFKESRHAPEMTRTDTDAIGTESVT